MATRGVFLEVAVDKIEAFCSVFVYFDGDARSLFGGGGRQNSGFLLCFCLLRWSRAPFLKVAVDKIRAFCSVFVYFEGHAEPF